MDASDPPQHNPSKDNTEGDATKPSGSTPPGVAPITQREAALMLAVERERADKEAIIKEFGNAPTTDAYQKVKDLFANNVIDAADTVVSLARHAESESLRASMSKYIIDTYLGKGKISGDDAAGDFKKFIESLTNSSTEG